MGSMDCADLDQDSGKWPVPVCRNESSSSTICGKFLTSWGPISFSGRTLLHEVSYVWISKLWLNLGSLNQPHITCTRSNESLGYESNGNVDRYVMARGCGPTHPHDLRPNTPLTHLSLKARHSTYDSLVYLLTWQVSCATNCVASLTVSV